MLQVTLTVAVVCWKEWIHRAGAQVIKAKVPLSEMFGYVTQLRSLSSGRATSTMEFCHYAPAPNNIAEEVIAKGEGKGESGRIICINHLITNINPPNGGFFIH